MKFGGLEAMITGLCDNYPHLLRRNREVFVAVLIVIIYLCALPTTTHVSLAFFLRCAVPLANKDRK